MSFKTFYLYNLRGIGIINHIANAYEKKHPEFANASEKLKKHKYHKCCRITNLIMVIATVTLSQNQIYGYWIYQRLMGANATIVTIEKWIISLLAFIIVPFIAVFLNSLIFYFLMARD